MKAVILAGGFGSRLSEETSIKPKPMIEIGEEPILWHIMKMYSHYGVHDFIICLGYKGWLIKEYFAKYFLRYSDVTFDLRENAVEIHDNRTEPWKVTLVDTGPDTYTGGRLKKIRSYVDGETFCATYGDGVRDVDIGATIDFHRRQDALVTMTAVQPPGRFGSFSLDPGSNKVHQFHEKPKGDGAWINGGFFVMEPEALDYVHDDRTWWEFEPLEQLARDGKLAAYSHEGYWQCMDHLSDKIKLEKLWASDAPPWKKW